MNIAVNTRLLLKNRLEGIGRFTLETFKRITVAHPEHNFIFLFDRNYSEEFIFSSNVTPMVVRPQARHPLLFKIWFEWSVNKALKKCKADLFISPDGYLSLSSKLPAIAVIHDLNFEHRPKDLPANITRYYRTYFPRFAAKAKRIATVSDFSKHDIMSQYKIDDQLIDVVYNGSSEIYHPLQDSEQDKIRAQYSNGLPFFIYVGSLHKRKNILNMLKAFDLFKEEQKAEINFLVVGDPLWKNEDLKHSISKLKHKDAIRFLGYKNQLEISRLLPSALALILISHFEGFGIPVIEAMYCDVPVIASDCTSLPEVVGVAGCLVNPDSVQEISNAMTNIWRSPQLRNKLINAGREQRKKFSWELTANKMWACIEKVISN